MCGMRNSAHFFCVPCCCGGPCKIWYWSIQVLISSLFGSSPSPWEPCYSLSTIYIALAFCMLHPSLPQAQQFFFLHLLQTWRILYSFCVVVLTLPVELAPHSTNFSYTAKNKTSFKTVSSDKRSKRLSLPVYHADIPVGGSSTYTAKNETGFKTVFWQRE